MGSFLCSNDSPDHLEAPGWGTHFKEQTVLRVAHKEKVLKNILLQNFFRDCILFQAYYNLEKSQHHIDILEKHYPHPLRVITKQTSVWPSQSAGTRVTLLASPPHPPPLTPDPLLSHCPLVLSPPLLQRSHCPHESTFKKPTHLQINRKQKEIFLIFPFPL